MKLRHLFILGILATTVSTLTLANTHQDQADTQLAANGAYHDFEVLGTDDTASNKHAKVNVITKNEHKKAVGVANAHNAGKKKAAAKQVTSKKGYGKETHHIAHASNQNLANKKAVKEKAVADYRAHQTATTTKAKSVKPQGDASQKMAQAIVARPSTHVMRQENKIAIARIDSSLQVAMRQEPSRVMADNQ